MVCIECGDEMPPERAEIFQTCIKCTVQTKILGIVEFIGDDPQLTMFKSSDKNAVNYAEALNAAYTKST